MARALHHTNACDTVWTRYLSSFLPRRNVSSFAPNVWTLPMQQCRRRYRSAAEACHSSGSSRGSVTLAEPLADRTLQFDGRCQQSQGVHPQLHIHISAEILDQSGRVRNFDRPRIKHNCQIAPPIDLNELGEPACAVRYVDALPCFLFAVRPV